ncbi:conserved exported hypothetical protein [Candidatus Zixiibacteriota bacterium]|nr:conserved exported hypothetical protein [candidate division Zixibacteria bacterium]
MKYKSVIIILVLLAISLSTAYAGSERRIGTAGAQELRIPVGARGTALGGDLIADVSGVESMYYNPAGMANMEGTEALFSHQPYIADIKINFAGVATNIANFGTIGASAKVVSIGDMIETTEEFPDGTGRVYSPSLSVLSVSYAKSLTYNVAFGLTAKFLSERIFEVSATGVAFDVGFIYNPNWHGVKLGMAIRNYGPQMRFNGDGFNRTLDGRPVRPEGASFDLPSAFVLGMSYNFLNSGPNSAVVMGNFMSNNYSQDTWMGGAEYSYDGKYFLRAGYNYSSQTSYIYGFTMGAGLAVNFGKTKVTFEYAWSQTDVFDNNQYFTGKINF